MKRAYVLLLAMLMLLTGCAGKRKINHVSVTDVCCPYEIKQNKEVVEITLRDDQQMGVLWHVDTVPEEICQVTQEDVDKEYTCRYRLTGQFEGTAQLTFTALQPDETACFCLDLVVNVDAKGKVSVFSYQHRERTDNSISADGLDYKWNIDLNGILNFSFINQEDEWSLIAEETDAFILTNTISTPVGCKFSAQATAAGQTTIVLTGENTKRKVHVVIQADEQGKMEVLSVQEQ